MATIQLSPIPPIPSPGDKDFETKIGKVLSHMPTLATELKTIADATLEAATVVDVDGNATVAATAASQASTAAGNAMSAAGTAATHANTAKTEATKAARSKSDAALAASQSGTNAVAAIGAAERAEAAVLAAEAIAAAKAEEVAVQAAADAATQAVSGVIAQAQASANAAANSAADANTAKNAAQSAATTAGQSVAAIATHAQTAQTASTAASNHAHNAGLRAAESLASAQQATSAGQAATAGAAQVLEILDNLNTGPVVSVNGKYGAVNLVKADLGLSNVDNTSDLAKPLSTAAQTALAGKSDTGHSHNDATTSAAGFMSAADKTKLDGVATNANNYTHPEGDGNLHVPATGTTNAGKVLTAGGTDGSLSWTDPLGLGSTAGTAPGTASAGTSGTAARSDHVHPLQSSVTGNAATATKLETARTINGVSFDGSANITINAVDSTAREPSIAAGTTAQYWRGDKSWRDFFTDVRAATLTGLSTATNAVISAADTVLGALGKLQKQVSDNLTTLTSHTGNTNNPHSVTKAQVGLGNVDNTSDASKPVSTAVQTALDAKQDTLVSGTNIKTVSGQSILGTGNIVAGLSNFTESISTSSPNNTTSAIALTTSGAATNIDFCMVAKGTGALLAQVPDGATGGNKRGQYATDFQQTRSAATQVAGGMYSVISGGERNTASGIQSAVSGGSNNTASGNSSVIGGGSANTASGNSSVISGGSWHTSSGNYSVISGGYTNTANATASTIPGGFFATTNGINGLLAYGFSGAVLGQNQMAFFGGRAGTTDATATRLTSDAGAASASNQLTLRNNSAFRVRGTVVARNTSTNDCKEWTFEALIKRGANAAATAIVGTPSITSTFADAAAASWGIAVTADTTNGALAITATGAASTSIRWTAVVHSIEVA